jgi:hypothetical protein
MASRLAWCATLMAVFVLGTVTCSGGGSSSSSGGGGGVCDPGDRQLCPCLGGAGGGVQDCRDDGTGWKPCEGCGGSSSGGSVCAPGATQACLCPSGGGQGVQTCMSTGAGWQPCLGCGGSSSSSSSSSSSGGTCQQGNTCDPNVFAGCCTGGATALMCDRNRLEPFQCRGPYGCSGNGCDMTKAAPGDACLSTWENVGATCSTVDQRVMLLCQNGVFAYYTSCGAQMCVASSAGVGCQ